MIGRFFSQGREQPRIFGIDLIAFLQFSPAQNLVHELVRKITFARPVGSDPLLQHDFLDPPHGFHFGNAGVGHAIHVPVQQILFVVGRQVPVVRHPLVIIMGHEIENILLQVRTRADNRVDLVAPDHLRERNTQFRRRHGAGQRDQHLSARLEVTFITLRRIQQGGRVEVAVVCGDKSGDRSLRFRESRVQVFGAPGVAFGFRHDVPSEIEGGCTTAPQKTASLISL